MVHHSSDQFDFDDWAGLYMENPREFEARRQAVLMIELAKGSAEQRAAGRAILTCFEQRAKGCDVQERMQVAASMMLESTQQLKTELKVLQQMLASSVENDEG